jgi:Protein of unknown function (DUF3574)
MRAVRLAALRQTLRAARVALSQTCKTDTLDERRLVHMRPHSKPFVFASLLLGAAVVLPLQLACTEPSAAATAATLRCTAQTTSRLYFGLDSPEGPVSDEAWQAFVDRDITPRLPDGFTWLAAKGQWRGNDGVIHREDARVLEVVGQDSLPHRQALAEIAARYKLRFAQQAVLVTQSPSRACW